MIIKLIVVQYKDNPISQFMPNVVDAWDQWTLEDNYQGFEDSLREHEARIGKDYDAVRVVDVGVPDGALIDAFRTITIAGRVVPA